MVIYTKVNLKTENLKASGTTSMPEMVGPFQESIVVEPRTEKVFVYSRMETDSMATLRTGKCMAMECIQLIMGKLLALLRLMCSHEFQATYMLEMWRIINITKTGF